MFDENNGALVLISGKLDIQDSLKDEKYDDKKILCVSTIKDHLQNCDSVCCDCVILGKLSFLWTLC